MILNHREVITAQMADKFLADAQPDYNVMVRDESPLIRYAAACVQNRARTKGAELSWQHAGAIAVQALQKIHKTRFKGQGKPDEERLKMFKGLLAKTACNVWHDEQRRSKRDIASSRPSLDHIGDKLRAFDAELHRQQVLSWCHAQILGKPDALSIYEQDCLRLVCLLEIPVQGAAEQLGRSRKSVENALHSGRKKLRIRAVKDGLVAPGERVIVDEVLTGGKQEGCYQGTGGFHVDGERYHWRSAAGEAVQREGRE